MLALDLVQILIATTAPKHWQDSDGVSHKREADVRHHTEFMSGLDVLKANDAHES